MSKSLDALAAELEAAQSEHLTRIEMNETTRARAAAASSVADIARASAAREDAEFLVRRSRERLETARAAYHEALDAIRLDDIRARADTDPGKLTFEEMSILDKANRETRAADPEMAALDARVAEYDRRRARSMSTAGFEDVRDALAREQATPLPDWMQRVIDRQPDGRAG